jgi:hypothetical protein
MNLDKLPVILILIIEKLTSFEILIKGHYTVRLKIACQYSFTIDMNGLTTRRQIVVS